MFHLKHHLNRRNQSTSLQFMTMKALKAGAPARHEVAYARTPVNTKDGWVAKFSFAEDDEIPNNATITLKIETVTLHL